MPAELIWELSARGMGESAGPVELARCVNIARAAEIAGYRALRIPGGINRPDAWLLAAALATHVRQIRFLVSLRPGLELPAVAARRAATLAQILDGRLDLEIEVGRDAAEHRIYGDSMNHDDRFGRADEFLSVFTRAWQGRTGLGGFDHAGEHYRIQDGGLDRVPGVTPSLYASGGTPGIESVAATFADTYYDTGESLRRVAERIRRIRLLAADRKRTVKNGCRIVVAGVDHPVAEHIERLQELGVESFILSGTDPLAEDLWIR